VGQQRNIDSLQVILKNTKSDSVKCLVLNQLFEISPADSKEELNAQLEKIIQAHSSALNQGQSFYYSQNAKLILNQGLISADKGDLLKALADFNWSLSLMNASENKAGKARVLYEISELSITQGDFEKSYKHAKESYAIYEQLNNKYGMADCWEDLGNYHEYYEKNLEKALACYFEGLKLCKQLGYKKRLAYLQGNIARVYLKQNKIDDALVYNFSSLRVKEEIGDKKGAGYSLHKIGQVYFKEGNIKMAFDYALKSMVVAQELGYPASIKRSAELLNKVYKKQGKYKEASEMFELFIQMRDSLNNLALQKAAVQKEMQFEYEQKKLYDKVQMEKEEAVRTVQKRKQMIVMWSVVVVLIIVALFAIMIYRALRHSNHQKKIIEEKQKEILDSIHYARRIQKALITNESYINKSIARLKK
jgi:tetratricopeptide (TPR) repeat protein